MLMKPFSSLLVVMAIGLTLSFAACVKKSAAPAASVATAPAPELKTPEDVVKYFIQVSATAKNDQDRAKLRDLCSGEMRRAFDQMTPDAFRISYLNNNVKVKDIKVIANKVQNDTATIRYQVSIDNAQGTDVTQEANEREVELSHTGGNWYIDTIRPKGSDKIAFTRGMIF